MSIHAYLSILYILMAAAYLILAAQKFFPHIF